MIAQLLEKAPLGITKDAVQDDPKEERDVAYQYLNFSDGAAAAEGTWASGPTPDGKGEFSYHDGPTSTAPMPPPTHPDSRFYGTTELPNIVEKAAGGIQDAMKKE
jgi:Mn-containing catalase